jgi:hypothetical protein
MTGAIGCQLSAVGVRSRALVVLLASSFIVMLGAGSGSMPAFDHDLHKAANEKAGLTCTACHTLGAGGTGPTGMAATMTVEREALCHGCHVKGATLPVDGAKVVKGTRSCEACHVTTPVPISHGAGWQQGHGPDARVDARGCRDCHQRRDCVDCHERKESARFRVHDRSWEYVHGIAVRTDPAACDACHLQADCVACHATDRGRAP